MDSAMQWLFSRVGGMTHDLIEAVNEVPKNKLLDIPLGLVVKFRSLKLTEGVSRLILPGANDQ